MVFQVCYRLPPAMARRRTLALLFSHGCSPSVPSPSLPPPSPTPPQRAPLSTDFLNLDDLPPPRMPLPRPRSFLSSKRQSLSRRQAARELPDELADFHGLENSTFQDVLDRLDRLDKIGIRAHPATYAALLQSAGNRDSLKDGKLVHDHIVVNNFAKDMALSGLIIQMYRRCKSVEGAREWFDKIEKKNIYMWQCMLETYAQYGRINEALELFYQIHRQERLLEKEPYLAAISVITGQEFLHEARRLHSYIYRSPYKLDVTVGTAVVSMYGRCGDLKNARKMFLFLTDRPVEAWNALIVAYLRNQHYKEALDFFEIMTQHDEIPDKLTINCALVACANVGALIEGNQIRVRISRSGLDTDNAVLTGCINMYGKCGNLQEAQSIFDEMKERDIVVWNTLIKVYIRHGHGKEALELFARMKKEELTPNRVTYILSLAACASQGALTEGRDIHSQIKDKGLESDVAVCAALIYMYGECGCPEGAREVRGQIPSGLNPDNMLANALIKMSGKCSPMQVTRGIFDEIASCNAKAWISLIAALARNGQEVEAKQQFEKAQADGDIPDNVTYASILSPSSQERPNHYVSLAAFLGRDGKLEEIEETIYNVPFIPPNATYSQLLAENSPTYY